MRTETSRRVLTADSPIRAHHPTAQASAAGTPARRQKHPHGGGACGANGAAPSAATRDEVMNLVLFERRPAAADASGRSTFRPGRINRRSFSGRAVS